MYENVDELINNNIEEQMNEFIETTKMIKDKIEDNTKLLNELLNKNKEKLKWNYGIFKNKMQIEVKDTMKNQVLNKYVLENINTTDNYGEIDIKTILNGVFKDVQVKLTYDDEYLINLFMSTQSSETRYYYFVSNYGNKYHIYRRSNNESFLFFLDDAITYTYKNTIKYKYKLPNFIIDAIKLIKGERPLTNYYLFQGDLKDYINQIDEYINKYYMMNTETHIIYENQLKEKMENYDKLIEENKMKQKELEMKEKCLNENISKFEKQQKNINNLQLEIEKDTNEIATTKNRLYIMINHYKEKLVDKTEICHTIKLISRYLIDTYPEEIFNQNQRVNFGQDGYLTFTYFNNRLRLSIDYRNESNYTYDNKVHKRYEDFEENNRINEKKKEICIKYGLKYIVIPYTCSTFEKLNEYFLK